jgi:hypothetical protein
MQGLVLTPEQQKTRRQRNVALAASIGFLVVLFYAVTIVKFAMGWIVRPL